MNDFAPDPGGNILVVDDTPANLRLLTDILTAYGYKVRPVPNGRLALRSVEAALPDLILLDINMPGMNGYDVCAELKANASTRDIPVIFISALDEVLDKVKAFEAGGVDYIAKPFQMAEVIARIKTHLTIGQLRQELQRANDELEQRVEERTAELAQLNAASQRFVPNEFLRFLQKESITDIRLGDQTQREMTILFSDIRDFTTLSETMSPQENFNFLNSYLNRISPIIRQHNGFVDKYLGDGIMALFPDKPEDALAAAVAMCQEVRALNQDRLMQGQRLITIGAGLHTGNLMLGIIGEAERLQGTVISDAVNMASRMEGLTKIYGVAIAASKQTVSALGMDSKYRHRFLDRVRVKGKQETITVFEVFDGDEPTLATLKADTKALFEEGTIYYHNREFENARAVFRQVLQQNPDDQAVWLYLERAEQMLNRGEQADSASVELMISD